MVARSYIIELGMVRQSAEGITDYNSGLGQLLQYRLANSDNVKVYTHFVPQRYRLLFVIDF